MFDVIANLIGQFQIVVVLAFIAATGGMMLLAYVKTRSAPAVLGVAVLGVAAIVLVTNMTTVANRFGDDVLGDERVTVEQVTGRSGPGQSPPSGDPTATTVCTQQQAEVGSC